MGIIYRDDPPFEIWQQLVRSAYATDLWTLAETDFYLWKKAFGKRFRMIVAYDEASNMVSKYRLRYNFLFENNFKIILYQINPSRIDLSALRTCRHVDSNSLVVSLSKENLAEVLDYDKRFQDDLDRVDFLRLFLLQDCAETWVAFDESFGVIGYGTARLLINNELFIGPLYANTSKTADSLYYSLLTGKFQGLFSNLQLQVPSNNLEGLALVDKLSQGSCTKEDYTIGLATKFRLKTESKRVYSTTEYDLSFL